VGAVSLRAQLRPAPREHLHQNHREEIGEGEVFDDFIALDELTSGAFLYANFSEQ